MGILLAKRTLHFSAYALQTRHQKVIYTFSKVLSNHDYRTNSTPEVKQIKNHSDGVEAWAEVQASTVPIGGFAGRMAEQSTSGLFLLLPIPFPFMYNQCPKRRGGRGKCGSTSRHCLKKRRRKAERGKEGKMGETERDA